MFWWGIVFIFGSIPSDRGEGSINGGGMRKGRKKKKVKNIRQQKIKKEKEDIRKLQFAASVFGNINRHSDSFQHGNDPLINM